MQAMNRAVNGQNPSVDNDGIPHRNWEVVELETPRTVNRAVDGPAPLVAIGAAIDKAKVFAGNSLLGLRKIMSEEMLINCAIPPLLIDMANTVYIDDNTPVMVDKLELTGRKTCPVDFNTFLVDYVSKMDYSAELLKEQQFSSVDEAYLVLCQMIRSYVPNLAAHKYKNRGRVTTFVCSTRSHRNRTSENRCDCGWNAKLARDDNGIYHFTMIASFGKHCEQCIKNRARFTEVEVNFQYLFPKYPRSVVAGLLKQIPVDETTITMRKNRAGTILNKADQGNLMRIAANEDVRPGVSSLPPEQVGTKEEPTEAYRLLQLLSYFERKDQAHAKAFFEYNEKERLCLSMMCFMWPEGINLLKTHSEAIFCDSMWNVNEDGDHILTIVVVDKEEKLHLAASAIAFRENEVSWTHFFGWVKECVKEFDPQCIVTDGAKYIHQAFAKSVKEKVFHASCWWHRNKAVKKLYGTIGAIAKNLQTIVFADSIEELVKREEQVIKQLEQ